MKLLRARVENFRLLKEIEFDFATSPEKNLSVIRAANASGKTTLLIALQWGLFGDDALPENFRLSPLDASKDGKATLMITVEVEYEVPTRTGTRTYRLIRFVEETVWDNKWNRKQTNVNLFHLTQNGADPVDNPEAHIRPYLAEDLREVFFTDGDRALSFIEGEKGDQKKRVEGAIRSLLGLGVIEDALGHVRTVSSEINKRVHKEADSKNELEKETQKLVELEVVISDLEKEYHSAKESRINLEDFERDVDAKLTDALRKGNREELVRQRMEAIQFRKSAEEDVAQATRDQANLFKSELLGKSLLAGPFHKSKLILDKLHSQGKIPKQTIPVLEDRLNQPTCICGESLDLNDPDGQKRQKHILRLIEDNRNPDEIQKNVSALYYSAKALLEPMDENTWVDEYKVVFDRRQSASDRQKKYGEAEREADAKIAKLPDVDIQQLHTTKNQYRDQARQKHSKEVRKKTLLEEKLREKEVAEQNRKELLQKDTKGKEFISELEVAKDLETIMHNALETMKTRELEKVSQSMNNLFLSMIGGDTSQDSQKSIITRAEITPEFRIVVFSHQQTLDPSQDLNGASRRALTIAFILALTKVSEVQAPNVIDTPLGMTSGYVKTAILQLATQQSSQLILFLTHDEIKGCEDILDKYAGKVHTLTNSAHYPNILVNDPGVNDAQALLCECDHNRDCKICKRREKVDIELGSSEMNMSERKAL